MSSPLLHPGRLGHHDAVTKYSPGGVGATNGAGVPILQSPLLRLAREHCIKQNSPYMKHSYNDCLDSNRYPYFSATSLSNTSSPSILRSHKVKEKKHKYNKRSKKPPNLPPLHQEICNSTYESLRISTSSNEISNCGDSSSSNSCEKIFKSHSYHSSGDSKNFISCNKENVIFTTDYSSRIPGLRSSAANTLKFGGSSSPIMSHKTGAVPFVNTLPTIASSPLLPASPASSTSPGNNKNTSSQPPGYDLFLSKQQYFFPSDPVHHSNHSASEFTSRFQPPSKFFSDFDDDNLDFIDASSLNCELNKMTLANLITNSSVRKMESRDLKLPASKPFLHSPSAPHIFLPTPNSRANEQDPFQHATSVSVPPKKMCDNLVLDTRVIPSLSVWSPSPSEATNTDEDAEGKNDDRTLDKTFNFSANQEQQPSSPVDASPDGICNETLTGSDEDNNVNGLQSLTTSTEINCAEGTSPSILTSKNVIDGDILCGVNRKKLGYSENGTSECDSSPLQSVSKVTVSSRVVQSVDSACDNQNISSLSAKEQVAFLKGRKQRIASIQKDLQACDSSPSHSSEHCSSPLLDRKLTSKSKIITSPHMLYRNSIHSSSNPQNLKKGMSRSSNIRTSPFYRHKNNAESCNNSNNALLPADDTSSQHISVSPSKSDSLLAKKSDTSRLDDTKLDNSCIVMKGGRPKSITDMSGYTEGSDIMDGVSSATVLNNNNVNER